MEIPAVKPFKPIDFPDYKKIHLDNGIPVFLLPSNEYRVVKLEVNYMGGRSFEAQQGVARACAHQIKEGTTKYSSRFISDEIDFYGATLNTHGGMDFSRLELYSLTKFFPVLLPIVEDVLHNPLFPEKELVNYQQRNINRLTIDLAKNDILAYRALTESIFGKNHPYGYNSTIETVNALNKDLLKSHFETNFLNSKPSIILAGHIPDNILNNLNDYLGKFNLDKKVKDFKHKQLPVNPEILKLKGKQKFQTSIRIGRKLFDRSHEDYPAVYFLNTILGGYFGSRLMQNIREEKGLTYDIYSAIDMLWKDGYLMVGAEVDNMNVDITIEEVFQEFEMLKKEIIGEDELLLVKNYINGNLLNLKNGPFNAIELMRLIAINEHDIHFFNNFMKQIQEIDSMTLQKMADKYLNRKDFSTVVVGI